MEFNCSVCIWWVFNFVFSRPGSYVLDGLLKNYLQSAFIPTFCAQITHLNEFITILPVPDFPFLPSGKSPGLVIVLLILTADRERLDFSTFPPEYLYDSKTQLNLSSNKLTFVRPRSKSRFLRKASNFFIGVPIQPTSVQDWVVKQLLVNSPKN